MLAPAPVAPRPQPQVIVASGAPDLARRVQALLGSAATVHASGLDAAAAVQQHERVPAGAVLLDFMEAPDVARAVAEVLRAQGAVVLGALGRSAHAADAIAALRANVQEFIAVDGSAEDAQQALARLLQQRDATPAGKGTAIALLGARGGLGTTTLAASLATLLHRQAPGRRTLLLDLGLPVADSAVLLGVESAFHFAEAARGLDRLDRTLVDSALPRTAGGLAVLPLPAQLQELREVSNAAATSTIARLREFFDALVLDLGAFTNTEFVLRVAGQCDHCLLVCDQAATSVHSAARLAGEIADKGIACELVANRVDPAVAPTPAQLAGHLRLPLAATLPERHAAHLRALNEGRLLVEAAPGDPYVRAVGTLAARFAGTGAAATAAARPRLLDRLLGRKLTQAA